MENVRKAFRRVERSGFDLNERVVFTNCSDGLIYLVTGISVRNNGAIGYIVSNCGEELYVSEFEIEKAAL